MEPLKIKLRELCGIDTRSLSLFRIGLGLILLVDLCLRMRDLTSHYTEDGVLPIASITSNSFSRLFFSIHFLNDSFYYQLALFILAICSAIALLVGYRTRFATILSWILLVSLHNRNLFVLDKGDDILRMLVFWSMFLPLGSFWSLDHRRSKKIQPSQIVSISSLALLLQICFIYWFTALLKTDVSWRVDGLAIWYALSIEQFATSFGNTLLNYPALLKFFTFATFYLELFGPFLAFYPFWTQPLRFLTAIMFILFHLAGINLTMDLGIFQYICALAWIVFIPGWFWEHIMKMKNQESPIFQQTTGFSNGLAAFFLIVFSVENLNSVGMNSIKLPTFDKISHVIKTNQRWDMFAPRPYQSKGWVLVPAKLNDNTEVDLLTGGPVNWEKPPLLSLEFKNARWKAYLLIMCYHPNENNKIRYANYLANLWNKNHSEDKKVRSFDIIFMNKINDPEMPLLPFKQKLIWHYDENGRR